MGKDECVGWALERKIPPRAHNSERDPIHVIVSFITPHCLCTADVRPSSIDSSFRYFVALRPMNSKGIRQSIGYQVLTPIITGLVT